MSKEITTQILIHAAPEKVWNVLTNFSDYPRWNPFIKSVKGEVATGKTITVRLEQPDAAGMTIKPRVLAFEPEKEFRWAGHLLFKGIFDGEHSFRLTDNGNGTTTFIHSEKFGGILVPFMAKMLDNNTKRGFELMNSSLKERSEALISADGK